MSAQSSKTFQEAEKDPIFWGHLVESAVGAHLLNSIRGTQIELYYWREKDEEIDFVLKSGDSIIGIEVKSNKSLIQRSASDLFIQNLSLEKFYSLEKIAFL